MDKTIIVQGKNLFYRDQGEGMPVVLVHGFAEDGAVWEDVAPALSTTCRVLVPDLPGSGRSALPEGEVTMESLASVLALLLDAEGIDRCVFIGHSMGGYITLAFAERYPERVSAFGLFHSTAFADNEEKKKGRRKSIEFIREHGVAPFIRQSAPNLFAASTLEDRSVMVEAMIERYSTFSAESLMAYLEAMRNRPERISVLSSFPRPVLFIIGEQDQVIPVEQVLKQVHIPGISSVRILPGAGHMGMLEDAENGVAVIHVFLKFIHLS
jgi:pimeloyl-ACP methyl ester carboxylesterase